MVLVTKVFFLTLLKLLIFYVEICLTCFFSVLWSVPHAHQLKNENKMNFRSNKLKTRNVLLVLKSTHQNKL
jgi:hypothetical protein